MSRYLRSGTPALSPMTSLGCMEIFPICLIIERQTRKLRLCCCLHSWRLPFLLSARCPGRADQSGGVEHELHLDLMFCESCCDIADSRVVVECSGEMQVV